ncbi:hypothetical protein DICVIV_00921 [Dictyocaulus viviparus]|uniref:Chitin binding Peritrophin-A domain protein n=1 Tax=Dictyocaulus viviparus TaxID=29172 RepID=A0A0D8Y827_DICVI|nr:hypothetical protein DICVIV_00921 [Dictyocaulus viviparus]
MYTHRMLPYLFLFPHFVLTKVTDEDGCPPFPTVQNGYAHPPNGAKNGETVFITCQYNSSLIFEVQCKDNTYASENFVGCPDKDEPYMPDYDDPSGCKKYDGYYPHTHAIPQGPYKNGEEFDIICDSDPSVLYTFVCLDGYYRGYFDGCPDSVDEGQSSSGC